MLCSGLILLYICEFVCKIVYCAQSILLIASNYTMVSVVVVGIRLNLIFLC